MKTTLTASRDPYRLQHDRKRAIHGPATDHLCVECQQPAAEWSLDPNPQGQLHCVRSNGRAKWISDDLADYSPRCRSCHRLTDRALRQAVTS